MAKIGIIGGRSGTLRPWLFRELKRRLDGPGARPGVRQIVLVPEQYTLQAERDLIDGLNLPGLLDLDVVSPTKLKTMVRERAGTGGRRALDETGRALAIHRALNECGDQLMYYRGIGELSGAVPRMDRTLTEIRESGLRPESLEVCALGEKSGARRAKLLDLAAIWRAYEGLTAERFEDPAEAWSETCRRLGRSGLWNGAEVWIYGFDTVRPDLRELVAAAAPLCARVTVLLTMTGEEAPNGRIFRAQQESVQELQAALAGRGWRCSRTYLPDGRRNLPVPLAFLEENLYADRGSVLEEDPAPFLSLLAAANPTAEAWNATETLMSWHREGMSWRRMAVALPGDSAMSSALTAALRRNGIPFFHSRKERVARHGVSRLLCGALECVSGGYRTESVLRAAMSGFGTLTAEEGTRLENYALTNGIDRRKWQKPFTRGPEAGEMEELRRKVTGPIDRLHEGLRSARDAGASVEAVVRFLQEENVWEQLQERQRLLTEEELYAEAVVDRQVWELLMNILDQIWALLDGRRATLREMARFVAGALERGRIASLPEEEEGVAIGEIGHMLPGETDALILCGMNDGALGAGESGLLTDAERESLSREAEAAVGLNQGEMAMVVRADLYRTMTLPEKYLRVSWSLHGEDGRAGMPGEAVTQLRRLFPALKEEGGLQAEGTPAHPWTPWMALAGLGPRLAELRDGRREDLDGEWKSALRQLWRTPGYGETLQEMVRRMLPGPEDGRRISRETALRLFQADRVSISRLECYASCPYRHFVQYGLRPVPREAWDFSAGEAGDFFHSALERYVDRAAKEAEWPRLPENRVGEVMDGVLEELTAGWAEGPLGDSAAGAWQGEEYIRRVRHAASVLTRFAANSDFQVLGTEVGFGMEEDGLPPVVLTLEDGARVALQGRIDRLDCYRGPEGDCLRVMDLKSSGKELIPARMARGEQLQLMIYLLAAERGYPGSRGAAAVYFPVQDREVASGTPEKAEEDRMAGARMKGVVLAEEDVLRAMDRDISPYSVGRVFNRDGSVSKQAPWAVDRPLMQKLMTGAERRATELCGEIRSGKIPAAPSVESAERSACTWCEYAAVCGRRKENERPLETEMTFREAAEKNALRKSIK